MDNPRGARHDHDPARDAPSFAVLHQVVPLKRGDIHMDWSIGIYRIPLLQLDFDERSHGMQRFDEKIRDADQEAVRQFYTVAPLGYYHVQNMFLVVSFDRHPDLLTCLV